MKTLADHPVAWCKDFEGGRSFYTNVGANGDFRPPTCATHLAGAIQWTAGEADPVYSDCGATVLANYQQTKISAPRTSTSRSASTCCPTGASCRPPAAASCACTTPRRHRRSSRTLPVYTQQRGRALRPGDRQRLRHQPLGLPVLRAADRRTSSSPTARRPTITTPPNSAPTTAPTRASGTRASATSSSRASSSSTRATAAARSTSRSEQKILRVSNNRGACCHVAGDIDFDTRQQPVAGHGRRHAVRRRQLRRLLAAQRHEDRRDADGARHERDRAPSR